MRPTFAVMESPSGERPAVLLADDRPENLLAFEAVLGPLGVETVRANSGEEAVELALSRSFCAILMDVRMPGIDGFQAAQRIRAHPGSEVPLLFISASEQEAAHIEAGYSLGAVDYLLKPIDTRVLRWKVGALVSLWQRNQARLLAAENRWKSEFERNQGRYRTLLDDVPCLVWATDPEGVTFYWNRRFWSYSALTPEGTDLACAPIVHPDEQTEVREAWKRAISEKGPFERAVRLMRADGTWRLHLCRASPRQGAGSEFIGWIATAHDVEDLINGFFSAGEDLRGRLAHDLRNPLAAMVSALELLKAKESARPTVERVIRRQVTELVRVVEQLLDASHDARWSQPSAESRVGANHVEPGSRLARVLLVDDNLDVLETLADLLTSLGYHVTTAATAQAALEAVKGAPPDVAVLDVDLPDMDGYTLGTQLRRRAGGERLRLFALTGHDEDVHRARSRAAGFERHFVKPIEVATLVAALEATGT